LKNSNQEQATNICGVSNLGVNLNQDTPQSLMQKIVNPTFMPPNP